MIQGAGSNVGKSLVVAGLCRALSNRGYDVRPFKPQNMSNNAAAVADGKEIGRAQHLQARACRVQPVTDMNPVLLKPESETGSQVIVQGERLTTVQAREYAMLKPTLLKAVIESYHRLAESADIVVVEGAGSPAETNLRKGDIANMGFACRANVPVLLVGDIDRGGVIAQLAGTKAVISPEDASMVQGFIINKFRGDVRLFEEGISTIERYTGWSSLGIIPWFNKVGILPSEDAQDLCQKPSRNGKVKVVCLALSRISNFDDLDPLRMESGLTVEILRPNQVLPCDTDIVIIPGSKSTCADLAFLRRNCWDIDVLSHVRRGGHVLGICGGYQMLGSIVRDPTGIEGAAGETVGLGLLEVETVMHARKRVCEVAANCALSGSEFNAYEIHIGTTTGSDTASPFAWINDSCSVRPDGAVSSNGQIEGTYLHGLFANDEFRRNWLRRKGIAGSSVSYNKEIDQVLDELAEHLEMHLDIGAVINSMG